MPLARGLRSAAWTVLRLQTELLGYLCPVLEAIEKNRRVKQHNMMNICKVQSIICFGYSQGRNVLGSVG